MGGILLVNIVLTIAVIAAAIRVSVAKRKTSDLLKEEELWVEYGTASTPEKAVTALNQLLALLDDSPYDERNERQRQYAREIILMRLDFLYRLTNQPDKIVYLGREQEQDELVRTLARFDYQCGILWGKLALTNDLPRDEMAALINLAGECGDEK